MKRFGSLAIAALLVSSNAIAGPPYVTDDPEPVELRHWELNLASQSFHDTEGWTGTAPHVEVNYGAIPNVQLHVIAPLAYSIPDSGARAYGYGDTELGVKFRFVQERRWIPMIGTFPLLEVPSGSRSAGLETELLNCFCRFGSKRPSGHGRPMAVSGFGWTLEIVIGIGGISDGRRSGKSLSGSRSERRSSTKRRKDPEGKAILGSTSAPSSIFRERITSCFRLDAVLRDRTSSSITSRTKRRLDRRPRAKASPDSPQCNSLDDL